MLVDPHILVQLYQSTCSCHYYSGWARLCLAQWDICLADNRLKRIAMWFSMAQVGEFAFIIATFRSFAGCHQQISLPCCSSGFGYYNFPYPYDTRCRAYLRVLATTLAPNNGTTDFAYRCWNTTKHGVRNLWRSLIKAMIANTLIYGILSAATITIMFSLALPIMRRLSVQITGTHWTGNVVCGRLPFSLIAPFLRAFVMKKNHSEEFKTLWTVNRMNRLPLVSPFWYE